MNEMLGIFMNSLINMLQEMTGIEIEQDDAAVDIKNEVQSLGISSILNFSGKTKGRLLLDFEPAMACAIAEKVYGEPYTDIKDPLLMAAISELNNIVAGDATTILNNEYKMSLRLAPPMVFTGNGVRITIPQISSESVMMKSSYGRVVMNVAFEGGK